MVEYDGEKFESVFQLIRRMISVCLEQTRFQADSETDQKSMDDLKAELMRVLPDILAPKMGAGLLEFAVKKMGDDLPKYFRRGL